jgi:hypothetical protein
MRRDEELLGEVTRIDALLLTLNAEDYTTKLVRNQMEARKTKIEDELLAANQRRIELRFIDQDNPAGHGLSTTLLSVLLSRLQSTVSYGAWSMVAGPGVQGNLPTSIERSAMTEVVAMPPGSFGLVLRKKDNDFAQEFDQSIDLLVDLLDAASLGRFDEGLESKAAQLGKEASRKFELLLKKIASESLDTDFSWNNPDSRRDVLLRSSDAMLLSQWLAQVSPEVETVEVVGYLRRADSTNGSFKIELKASGEMIEGVGDVAMLTHTEIDALYTAQIEHLVQRSPHTGRTTEKNRLLHLSPSE